ncbi:MAG TPA: endolytic transglycosylase MltG [Bacteroidota bacterium]|nr:endolytic transglycosylase MltG [Bacteroidota bacterium]
MSDLPVRGKPLRWVLGGLAVLLVAGSSAVLWILFGPNTLAGSTEKIFFVSRGENFAQVVDSLDAKKIIRSRFEFSVVAHLMGGADRIQIGKYVLRNGISNLELFTMLRSGKGNQPIAVTIPEGARIRLQARIFARALGIDSSKYARLAFDPTWTRSLGVEAGGLEGYLLPDTYTFSWEQDEREILRREVEAFQKFFNDTLRAKCAEYGWSVHQAVTFASIVEGEAVLNEERPIISGVYHNRLRKGMRLEADPTIQYVIENGPRRLTYDDLKSATPYNTYLYAGLPPGPVNNPGRASLLAALYPQGNGYLFFVANGRGGHWFTRTYDEHLHYVRIYKRDRRARAASLRHGEM